MVHMSAIGADPEADSKYSHTKALGEAGVAKHMPGAVILRPSIIFGPEDQFFNRFAGMVRTSPVIPLVRANTLFQPVYVDDVAQAAAQAVLQNAPGGVYELGGPEVASFRALIGRMLEIIHRRRLVLALPTFAGRVMAFGFDMMQAASFGLIKNSMLTRDQVDSLSRDNVVAKDARGFSAFGIVPKSMASVLPGYLWRFRPSGQYDDIKNSAKNLRT